MRFTLVDKIVELVPAQRIEAIKCLSLAEEYLADHFPRFPVLPGVFMLEALTQTGAWLVRVTDEFAHAIVTLKEARNVKYSGFVEPGQLMTMTAEIIEHGDRFTKIKATGLISGRSAVTARLVLERYNLGDTSPARAGSDRYTRQRMLDLFRVLYPDGPAISL
jgi:3-hydroxyacyl-[acyl-carrier-protein] dehydratase